MGEGDRVAVGGEALSLEPPLQGLRRRGAAGVPHRQGCGGSSWFEGQGVKVGQRVGLG